MANEENLKKGKATQFRSGEEAARNGEKGGVASGVARRRKRTMKQAAVALLGAGLDSGENEFARKLKARLAAFGIGEEDATYQDVMLAGVLLKAIKGDVRAAEFMRDVSGDSPYLEIKKQELKMRKEELRLKQAREAERTEAQAAMGEASSRPIDLSKVTDKELAMLDEIIGKITAEQPAER